MDIKQIAADALPLKLAPDSLLLMRVHNFGETLMGLCKNDEDLELERIAQETIARPWASDFISGVSVLGAIIKVRDDNSIPAGYRGVYFIAISNEIFVRHVRIDDKIFLFGGFFKTVKLGREPKVDYGSLYRSVCYNIPVEWVEYLSEGVDATVAWVKCHVFDCPCNGKEACTAHKFGRSSLCTVKKSPSGRTFQIQPPPSKKDGGVISE